MKMLVEIPITILRFFSFSNGKFLASIFRLKLFKRSGRNTYQYLKNLDVTTDFIVNNSLCVTFLDLALCP